MTKQRRNIADALAMAGAVDTCSYTAEVKLAWLLLGQRQKFIDRLRRDLGVYVQHQWVLPQQADKCRRPSGLDPIFHFQVFDPLKLSYVVGHHGPAHGFCMGSNPQVVVADDSALPG